MTLADSQPIERPRSLADIVTDRLRADIVDGRYDLGQTLRETALAHDLGVSRTPVREALTRLEMEGLVVVEQPRGASVFRPSRQELEDICDLRVCLESSALRYAVQRGRRGISEALAGIVEAMRERREQADTAGYLRLDTAFHAAFFAHCRNSYLSDAYQTIAAKMAAMRHRLGDHDDHMAKSFVEHSEIAEAVEAGAIDRALQILEGHIGRKEGSYWIL